ncbi:hypothetical protein KDI_21780 [Dictyobacter arantiisoli]|uniref:Uncharacterized protein n=1 Tax=Dictyobacter arantiisoli TaxID=2014874 RepID=A0A5A5TCE0_9CHLR|nr:hypothetical protein KDI_21780 [Dictyobacter arantiisoli]
MALPLELQSKSGPPTDGIISRYTGGGAGDGVFGDCTEVVVFGPMISIYQAVIGAIMGSELAQGFRSSPNLS